jgi:hypothetical protein
MVNKKYHKWLLIALILIIGGGLFWSWRLINSRRPAINMDELSQDNLYHYRNDDLGFRLDLPAEFIYYQTQRNNSADYSEIIFFVPTSDPDYIYEAFPSYARPIIVRVYNEEAWNQLSEEDENKQEFEKKMVKTGRVYLLKFWENQPNDWQDKWSDQMKEFIGQALK